MQEIRTMPYQTQRKKTPQQPAKAGEPSNKSVKPQAVLRQWERALKQA